MWLKLTNQRIKSIQLERFRCWSVKLFKRIRIVRQELQIDPTMAVRIERSGRKPRRNGGIGGITTTINYITVKFQSSIRSNESTVSVRSCLEGNLAGRGRLLLLPPPPFPPGCSVIFHCWHEALRKEKSVNELDSTLMQFDLEVKKRGIITRSVRRRHSGISWNIQKSNRYRKKKKMTMMRETSIIQLSQVDWDSIRSHWIHDRQSFVVVDVDAATAATVSLLLACIQSAGWPRWHYGSPVLAGRVCVPCGCAGSAAWSSVIKCLFLRCTWEGGTDRDKHTHMQKEAGGKMGKVAGGWTGGWGGGGGGRARRSAINSEKSTK